jgi:dTDP-4-dehydrorhamnose 3,5-epimerase
MIEGVQIKQLTTHPDERGFFREVLRSTDPIFAEGFGQLSHSLMHFGVIKAWHIQPLQISWWYVPIGALKVALHDLREGSPTAGVTTELLLGEMYESQVLKIPAGIAYGCTALIGPTHLLAVTSTAYDPEEGGRFSHDDPEIGYDWLAGPPIK